MNWRDNWKVLGVAVLVAAGLLWKGNAYREKWELERQEGDHIPAHWKHKVRAPGQFYPVPAAWLVTPEGREAHFLVLPDSLPKPVPFDFAKAGVKEWWPDKNRSRRIGYAYFKHLCATEGGKWIFLKVPEVKGLLVARRTGQPPSEALSGQYGPELPWMQRHREHDVWPPEMADNPFISPPHWRYLFVEQNHTRLRWEAPFQAPYIRLFGRTVEPVPVPEGYMIGSPGVEWNRYQDVTPLQAEGIATPTAEFAFTWRGITRPRDREFGVAGGELIVYRRQDKEVLGVVRSFAFAPLYPTRPGRAAWIQVPTCEGVLDYPEHFSAIDFVQEVLLTPPNQGVRIKDDRNGYRPAL